MSENKRNLSHETLVGLLKVRGPIVIHHHELIDIKEILAEQEIIYTQHVDSVSVRLKGQALPGEEIFDGDKAWFSGQHKSRIDGDGNQ